MNRRKYGHVPVVPPEGSTEKDRRLIIQINALFDDIYIQLGRIRESVAALSDDQGDDDNVNEND